jgi:GxxExxY protein
MNEFTLKEETYAVIGICMEVHNHLGHGFAEIVYKDALELEFQNNGIQFEREKEFKILYKDQYLKHKFYADLIICDEIILEIKCVKNLTDEHIAQTINYLKASGKHLALLINFSRQKLEYKRLIY